MSFVASCCLPSDACTSLQLVVLLKRSAQVQYNCSTSNFFLCCSCIALVRTPALQRCNNSSTTCRLLAAVVKKPCIAVVLHLCRLLQCNKIFVFCYCSCIALVRTALMNMWSWFVSGCVCLVQICDVCRESFEQCWSEERESWHLKDAISVDGKVGQLAFYCCLTSKFSSFWYGQFT